MCTPRYQLLVHTHWYGVALLTDLFSYNNIRSLTEFYLTIEVQMENIYLTYIKVIVGVINARKLVSC
jgi:hypothetical protein